MKQRSLLKRIAIDALGFLLVIAAIPISWIPGPGGIPVLILGLSLLATNHAWAERLLGRVKAGGKLVGSKLFSDNPRIKWLVDIIGILFISGAVVLITLATRSMVKTVGISLILVGLILFLGNRHRFHRIKAKFNRQA